MCDSGPCARSPSASQTPAQRRRGRRTRIEVRTVFRQKPELRVDGFDRSSHRGALVTRQVVHDDDVAGRERWHQDLQAPAARGPRAWAEGARRDHHHRGARRDVGHSMTATVTVAEGAAFVFVAVDHCAKLAPSIGPSNTAGAVRPVTRNAPRNVVVCQRPSGVWVQRAVDRGPGRRTAHGHSGESDRSAHHSHRETRGARDRASAPRRARPCGRVVCQRPSGVWSGTRAPDSPRP